LSAEATTAQPPSDASAILIPYHQDPLAYLADLIIRRHARALPDLTQCVVLLPDPLAAPRLRRLLLAAAAQHHATALLGPSISSLRAWATRHADTRRATLSPQARELLLVEILQQHRGLFGDSDPWLLAADLARLFAELTLHRSEIPSDIAPFITRLCKAYGTALPLAALSDEARLVHTLWQAWHRQLREEGEHDPETAYLAQLRAAIARDDRCTIYLAGYNELAPPEREWAQALASRGRLILLAQGERVDSAAGETLQGNEDAPHPAQAMRTLLEDWTYTFKKGGMPSPYSTFLDAVYAPRPIDQVTGDDHLFATRARHCAQRVINSPSAARLRLLRATSAEDEARAVDIQVRRWLLEGRTRIGIVTEDRRLARRLRALLERADVALHDAAGWALSTTSAAAALERWLETLEEDFAYQPLTDLLKSPFVFPAQERHTLLTAVHRFEQDIVQRENIGRDINRYRDHLAFRRARLPQAVGDTVQALLDAVEHAAEPLLPFVRSRERHSPLRMLAALEASLRALGMEESFMHDAAGQRVLQEIAAMRAALSGRKLPMHWRDFRTWLGRTLERFNFQAPAPAATVQLMNLAQSSLLHCDGLIIAGANAEHLPGSGEGSPFFNDAVRRELGLPTARTRYVQRFHAFRRLLECAPQVLITLQHEQNGEARLASPWVEALSRFHALAYGDELIDAELTALIDRAEAQVFRADTQELPAAEPRPAPRVAPDLLPRTISASAYQELMNCPYQFFATRCLRLSAPETVREALEKSDYGERVHLALQAFHGGGVPGYPGPYAATLTAANRAQAVAALEDISRAVFAKDLEDNFEHRGWLQRWLERIPEYIDWQIARQASWRVSEVEVKTERRYRDDWTLTGRLDRVDENAEGLALIDYKTGRMPSADEVQNGEAVQLPFYALLMEQPVQRVEYLALDKQVKSYSVLEGEALAELADENGRRLVRVLTQIEEGAPLPAWGDENVCGYCVMRNVCRKDAWSTLIVEEEDALA